MVGASVIVLVPLRWYVYAAMNRGISTRYTPTSFSIVCSGASGSRTASMNVTNASFGGTRQAIVVHLAQLGQPLVPQLGVPGVVIGVAAEHHLHVELGNGRDPAAEHLEQAHLGPLVVADAARRLLDGEQAGQLPAVPGRERRVEAWS